MVLEDDGGAAVDLRGGEGKILWRMAPSCNGGFPISHYRAGVCVHQIRPRQLNRALGTTEIHCPKRQRPGKAFSGFCKALLRLPMPVWWAFCDAVRSRVFHLLADRMTMEGWLPLGCDGSRMECPRTAELEQSLGKSSKDQSAPTLWVIALVSLTTGVLWSWLGDIQDGGTSLPDRSVGDAPPSGPPKRALGLRRGLRGLRLVRSVAEAAVLVSDPALFAGTTLQPGDGQGGGIHRGRVLVLDRRCREQEQASVASPGDPRGGAEAQERRLVGHQRSGPQALAGGIGGSILPDEVGK